MPDFITTIDNSLIESSSQNQFSGSLLVARGGEILLSKGYNLANREWNIPNAPDTKFRIASVTKQFTAMAILMLQEQGLLHVSDPICRFLDPCPEAWSGITIRHLLTHTSGIHSFTDDPEYLATQTLPSSPDETIRRFASLPLDFAPGAGWYYSNSGYIVLGKIIEAASGSTYRDFLRKNLLDPLGLADTDVDSHSAVITRRAEGYKSPDVKANYLDMTIPYAAGALYSTVEDLFHWTQALYQHKVVSQEAWDAMLADAAPVPEEPPPAAYAYGFFVREIGGHRLISHGGGIDGFTCGLAHVPDADFTVAVTSNFETIEAGLTARTILAAAFPPSAG